MTILLIVTLLTLISADPERDDLLVFQSNYTVE